MSYPIGVVPIFVNAGAAVLPAVLGAMASAAALLLKPRELLDLFRRRPLVPLITVAGIGAASLLVWLLSSAGSSQAARVSAGEIPAVHTDWAKVALDLIRQDELRKTSDVDRSPPTTRPSETSGPWVLGRDFSRCGFDGETAPLRLHLLWQHEQENAWFLSSPAVVGGKVYCGSCQTQVTAKTGSLFCLDAASGKPIWEAPDVGETQFKPFFSSPAISEDGRYLVIGQGLHEDADCELLCLDARTGKLHWKVKTPLHIESSPAIRGDMVVVGAGAIENDEHKAISHPGMVVAVRISDGQELWRAQVNDPESSPAIGEDGAIYIGSGFNGNAVVALRSQSDQELKQSGLARVLWRTSAPYPITDAVTLAGDLVIVGGGNSDYVYAAPHPAGVVMALDRGTGAVRWRQALPDAVLGPISAREKRLFCPVRDGHVACLSQEDGQILWQTAVSEKSPVLTGCASAAGHVYAASRDGTLAVIDAASGAVIERIRLNPPENPGEAGLCLSSPAIASGRLFIGSETGGLRCFTGSRSVR